MKNVNLKVGNVVKLTAKPSLGSQIVEVSELLKNGRFVGMFGLVNDGVFMRRTYIEKVTRQKVVSGKFKTEDVKEVVINGVKDMTKTKEVEPLLKPSQKSGKSKGKAKTMKMTAAEKSASKSLAEAEKSAKQAKLDKKREEAKAAKEAKKAKLAEKRDAEKAKKKELAARDALKLKIASYRQSFKEYGVVEADVVKAMTEQREGGAVEKLSELSVAEFNTYTPDIKKAITTAKKNNKLALRTALSDDEATERKKLEATVRANLSKFQSAGFEIGAALTIINQHKLYRSTHKTFATYVVEVFDLSEPQAYSVMTAARTFQALVGEDKKFALNEMPSIRAAEAIARGVDRFISDAGLKGDEEQKAIERQLSRNVFQLAVDTAPKDRNEKPILSPDHITSVFHVMNEIAKTGAVEVDGKQVPIDLAKAAIGEQIASESAERAKRLNQYLADRVEQGKQQIATMNASRLDAALNAASGELIEIPEGVTPKIILHCSVHGRRALGDLSEQFVELDCGCHFSNTPEGLAFTGNQKLSKKAKATTKKQSPSTEAPASV